jgi:N-acetyl-gamma-glutamyl-phosphate reductase
MEYAPSLLDIGKRVVDLSADFRLKDVGIYEEWYNTRHTASLLIDEAVYGLCELYRDKIREAKLIANPGCYPTSVILGLAPLLREGLIEEGSIIIDAKSGVSGAGRSPSELTHFPEANESIRAYSVFSHRHKPEIEQELSALAGSDIKVCFVPHLAPMSNGILTTIYAKLKREESLLNLYKQFYQGEPFVKILKEPPSVKDAVGTNLCLIHPASEKDRVVVLSCIDNLIKGASGQAVQNMNIMFGMDEIDGLI